MRCVVVTALWPYRFCCSLVPRLTRRRRRTPASRDGSTEPPGACGAFDRRSRQQHVRLGPPVGADRYHRQQAQRHAGTRSRDSMGGHGDEQGRTRERAHRARHGAQMGARERERGDCRAARHSITMLGLGDSVGTTADGIQAEVLVVQRPSMSWTRRRRRRAERLCCSTCRLPTTARP